uniref:AlNc14C73G4972 protein n=1 Tax=Albugo laibachii Nc14 TaxID=890382 RepID=F0WEB5_9STRA|nr:AlNc14C73G4972 [Albugo laibachii Nc14]|eukprot:CCA19546.1 AlNc14C73G4972 [Albugo laibachii Nc14]
MSYTQLRTYEVAMVNDCWVSPIPYCTLINPLLTSNISLMRAKLLIDVLVFMASILLYGYGNKMSKVGKLFNRRPAEAADPVKIDNKLRAVKIHKEEELDKPEATSSTYKLHDNKLTITSGDPSQLVKQLSPESKLKRAAKYGGAMTGGLVTGVAGMQVYQALSGVNAADAGNTTQWNTSGITPLFTTENLGTPTVPSLPLPVPTDPKPTGVVPQPSSPPSPSPNTSVPVPLPVTIPPATRPPPTTPFPPFPPTTPPPPPGLGALPTTPPVTLPGVPSPLSSLYQPSDPRLPIIPTTSSLVLKPPV